MFVHAVCVAGGDDEITDRVRAASDLIEAAKTNQKTTGWPTLAGYVGEDVVAKVRKWLGADKIVLKSGNSISAEVSWSDQLPLRREISDPQPYPIYALGDVLAPLSMYSWTTFQPERFATCLSSRSWFSVVCPSVGTRA